MYSKGERKIFYSIFFIKFFVTILFLTILFIISEYKNGEIGNTIEKFSHSENRRSSNVLENGNQETTFKPEFYPLKSKNHTKKDEENPDDTCPVQNVKLVNKHSQCQYATNDSDCTDNYFIYLYYCLTIKTLYPHTYIAAFVFFCIGTFLIFMMFYLIADTTDSYLAPSIIKIVDYLHLPSTVAGVTLLAFGNGSPDLFSILAGLLTDNTSLALSAPIGAGVFVSGVVFGLVILFSKSEFEDEEGPPSGPKLLQPMLFFVRKSFVAAKISFVRDVSFYIFAVSFIFVMYLFRFTVIFAGIALIGVYIFYVIVVVLGRYLYTSVFLPKKARRELIKSERKKYQERNTESENLITDNEDLEMEISREIEKYIREEDEDDWTGGWNLRALKPSKSVRMKQEEQLKKFSSKVEKVEISINKIDPSDDDDEKLISSLIQEDYFSPQKDGDGGEPSGPELEEVLKEKKKHFIINLWHAFVESIAWGEMSIVEKIFYLIFGWYTRFVRNLTNPKSEKEEWNKFFTCVTPTIGTMFFFFTFFRLIGIFQVENYIFLIIFFTSNFVVGLILSIIVFFTTVRDRPPIYNFVFVFLSFLVSICWIYTCAEILVEVLTVFGKIIKINPAIFGLTVLAWGNSFPDMVANVVIARRNFPQMAMGACFGEPLLNSLIGVGGLFTWMSTINLFKKKWCYPLGDDPALLISFITLIGQSIFSLVVISLMKFKIRRIHGVSLIVIYFVSLVVGITATFQPNVGKVFSFVRIGHFCKV